MRFQHFISLKESITETIKAQGEKNGATLLLFQNTLSIFLNLLAWENARENIFDIFSMAVMAQALNY